MIFSMRGPTIGRAKLVAFNRLLGEGRSARNTCRAFRISRAYREGAAAARIANPSTQMVKVVEKRCPGTFNFLRTVLPCRDSLQLQFHEASPSTVWTLRQNRLIQRTYKNSDSGSTRVFANSQSGQTFALQERI